MPKQNMILAVFIALSSVGLSAHASPPHATPEVRGCLRGFLWRHPDADGTFAFQQQADKAWAVQPVDASLTNCLAQNMNAWTRRSDIADGAIRLRIEKPKRNAEAPLCEISPIQATTTATSEGETGKALEPHLREWIGGAAEVCFERLSRQSGLTVVPRTLDATIRWDLTQRRVALDVAESPFATCLHQELDAPIAQRIESAGQPDEPTPWYVQVNVQLTGELDPLGDIAVLQQHAAMIRKCLMPKRRAGLVIERCSVPEIPGGFELEIQENGRTAGWKTRFGECHTCAERLRNAARFEIGQSRGLTAYIDKAKPQTTQLPRWTDAHCVGQAPYYRPIRRGQAVQFVPSSPAVPTLDRQLKWALGPQGNCLARMATAAERTQPWTLTLRRSAGGPWTATVIPDSDAARTCLVQPLLAVAEFLTQQPTPLTYTFGVQLAPAGPFRELDQNAVMPAQVDDVLVALGDPGSLVSSADVEEIAKKVRTRRAALAKCVAEIASRNVNGSDAVALVAFTVGWVGTVTDIRTAGVDDAARECITRKMSALRGLPILQAPATFGTSFTFVRDAAGGAIVPRPLDLPSRPTSGFRE